MKTKKIKITQVKINAENPRTITSDKFQKLVNSILVFPEMLELRPIVTDKTFTALGGNMRAQALKSIATMDIDAIMARLQQSRDYLEKTDGEKQKLADYWKAWLQTLEVTIADASSLTEAQKKEFIVKDNVNFGAWDYDGLANKFQSMKLQDWGMDVWGGADQMFNDFAGQQQAGGYPTPSAPTSDENDGTAAPNPFEGALPPELQGIDLTPAELPKIEGADETAMERVIIVFPKDKTNQICGLLGLEKLEKVIYQLSEIMPEE